MEVNIDVLFNVLVPVLLAINAYFIKDLLSSINQVKLELAKLLTQHDSTKDRIAEHSEDIKEVFKEVHKIRDRLHSVEGTAKTLVAYLEVDDK